MFDGDEDEDDEDEDDGDDEEDKDDDDWKKSYMFASSRSDHHLRQ